jgi:hypothetical protein
MNISYFLLSGSKKDRFYRHLSFWISWWLFQSFAYAILMNGDEDGWRFFHFYLLQSFADNLLFLPQQMFLLYCINLYVIPKFIVPKKYVESFVAIIILLPLTALVGVFTRRFLIQDLKNYFASLGHYRSFFVNDKWETSLSIVTGIRLAVGASGIGAVIKLSKYYYIKAQKASALENQTLNAEIKALKSQVNPHFLFNTLNNIYSTVQESSPEGSRMILKLSEILRFILKEGNSQFVPLSMELKILTDYINLEQERYDKKLHLQLQLADIVESEEYLIPPLLLLPLVENCFKHGASKVEDFPWIKIEAILKNGTLIFRIINGIAPEHDDEPVHFGIGLENVSKRLQLMYPNRHKLLVLPEQDVFVVNLEIKLSKKENYIPNEPVKETELYHS